MACLPNPYKLSILGDSWRTTCTCTCTILPFSSSRYFYSWLRLSNLVDLSFEYLSFSNKWKTTMIFPSSPMFLQLPAMERFECICLLIHVSVSPFSGSLRLDEPLNPPSPARNNHIHGSMQLAGHSKLHCTFSLSKLWVKMKDA